ncbi:MAG: hypothetical protein HQK49_19760 [Oligoflexia bacterium]|nr:hypothetical protein [Oligoflexia bacterium]
MNKLKLHLFLRCAIYLFLGIQYFLLYSTTTLAANTVANTVTNNEDSSNISNYNHYFNLVSSIDNKEKLLNQIFKLTLEDAHALSTLSDNNKKILCNEITSKWPLFLKNISEMPAMSGKTNMILIRVLVLQMEACLFSPMQFHQVLLSIKKQNSDLIKSLFQKPIAHLLPQKITGINYIKNNTSTTGGTERNLNINQIFTWVSSTDLVSSIYHQSCNNTDLKLDSVNAPLLLVENAECMAAWLLAKIFIWGEQNKFIDTSKDSLISFKSVVDNFINNNNNLNQIPINWYSFLSWPYRKLNTTNTNINLLRSLYTSKDYNGLLNFFVNNATTFSPYLNISAEDLRSIITKELVINAKKQSVHILQSMPASYEPQIDPMFLVTVGKYLYLPLHFESINSNQSQSSYKNLYNEIQNIFLQSTTKGFQTFSAITELPNDQNNLLNIQLAAADLDVNSRDNLGLMFSIGGTHDSENIKNNPNFFSNFETLAIDHVIGNFLRKIDNSPWVQLEESIEGLEDRQNITKLIINKLKGKILLQMLYLQQFDIEPDDQLINDIRNLAFKIENLRFDFHPTRLAIHNGFNESIIGLIDNYYSNLNLSEQQSIDPLYQELRNKLNRFFSTTANPETLIANDLKKISASWPVLVLELENDFNKMKNITNQNINLKLISLYEISSKLKNKINLLINPSPTDINADDESYFHLIRLYKTTHFLIVRYLPEIKFENKEDFLKQSQLYIKHLNELNELNEPNDNSSLMSISPISPTSPISPIATMSPAQTFESLISLDNLITDKLQTSFYPRLTLFYVFTTAQLHRYSTNSDYNFTMNIRRENIPLVVENLVRNFGFGLSFLFDPTNFDSTLVPDKKIMNEGESYGLLKFVDQEDINRYPYRFDEIIITNTLPTNLGVTAALITTVYQPHSSHVDLRTRERNTPNAYIKDALTLYKNLLNKWVRIQFKRNGNSILLEEVNEDLARNKIKEKLSQNNYQVPTAIVQATNGVIGGDEDVLDLDLSENQTTINKIGAKAFSYAHLRRLFGEKSYTPKGWAIPFHIYHWFVNNFNLNSEIEKLLNDFHNKKLTSKELEERLFKLRKSFKNKTQSSEFLKSPFYQNLISRLPKLIAATINEGHSELWEHAKGCLRFRSSTNAEDLIGLTGAGLYESKTGCLNSESTSKKSIASALSEVWSSLWTYRAFIEREYYGIDHTMVKMAVLVHRNYPNEEFSGVALSNSKMDSTLFISVAKGEESITNSTGGTKSDELVIIPNNENSFSISGRFYDKKSSMLSKENIASLVANISKIYRYYLRIFSHTPNISNMRMDVEFKFQNNRLYIKQARPY